MKRRTLITKFISLFLTILITSQTLIYSKQINYNSNNTLELSSIFTREADVIEIIMSESIDKLVALYNDGKIDDSGINEIIESLRVVAKKTDKMNEFLRMQAGLIFRLYYSNLGEIEDISILGGGHGGAKPILIETKDGEKYVFKSVTQNFASTDKRYTDVWKQQISQFYPDFVNYLAQRGVPSARILERRDETFITNIGKNDYVCMEFKEGKTVFPLEQFFNRGLGKIAAEVYNAQKGFAEEHEEYLITNPELGDLARMRQVREWRPLSKIEFEEIYKGRGVDQVEQRWLEYKSTIALRKKHCEIFLENYPLIDKSKFKKSFIHADIFALNVTFDEQTGEVIGIYDFDVAHYNYRIVEFLHLILAYNIDNPTKFQDILIGYQANVEDPLTEEEIRGIIEFTRFFHLILTMSSFGSKGLKKFDQAFSRPRQIEAFVSDIEQVGIAARNFREHFSYLGEIKDISVLEGGLSRVKPVLIETEDGSKYAFKALDSEGNLDRFRYIAAYNDRLRRGRISVPRFFRRQDVLRTRVNSFERMDAYAVGVEDNYFVLMEFLETGKVIDMSDVEPVHFSERGRLAAEMHEAVRGFRSDYVREGVDLENELQDYMRKREQYLLENGEGPRYPLTSELEEEYWPLFEKHSSMFLERFSALKNSFGRKLNIHADLTPGNVLFDESNRLVGVIDVANVRRDYRILDFVMLMFGGQIGIAPYSRENLLRAIVAYQTSAEVEPFNDDEIRGIIEVLRYRFINSDYPPVRFSLDPNVPPRRYRFFLGAVLKEFKKFDQDFRTEDQVEDFIRVVNDLVIHQREFVEYRNPRPIEQFDLDFLGKTLNPIEILADSLNSTLDEIPYDDSKDRPVVAIRGSSVYFDPKYAVDFDLHVDNLECFEGVDKDLIQNTLRDNLMKIIRQRFPDDRFDVSLHEVKDSPRKDKSEQDLYIKIVNRETLETKVIYFGIFFTDWCVSRYRKKQDTALIMTDYFDLDLRPITDVSVVRKRLPVLNVVRYKRLLVEFYENLHRYISQVFMEVKKGASFRSDKQRYLHELLIIGAWEEYHELQGKDESDLTPDYIQKIRKTAMLSRKNKILKRMSELTQYLGNRELFDELSFYIVNEEFDISRIEQILTLLDPRENENLEDILFQRFVDGDTLHVGLFSNYSVEMLEEIEERLQVPRLETMDKNSFQKQILGQDVNTLEVYSSALRETIEQTKARLGDEYDTLFNEEELEIRVRGSGIYLGSEMSADLDFQILGLFNVSDDVRTYIAATDWRNKGQIAKMELWTEMRIEKARAYTEIIKTFKKTLIVNFKIALESAFGEDYDVIFQEGELEHRTQFALDYFKITQKSSGESTVVMFDSHFLDIFLSYILSPINLPFNLDLEVIGSPSLPETKDLKFYNEILDRIDEFSSFAGSSDMKELPRYERKYYEEILFAGLWDDPYLLRKFQGLENPDLVEDEQALEFLKAFARVKALKRITELAMYVGNANVYRIAKEMIYRGEFDIEVVNSLKEELVLQGLALEEEIVISRDRIQRLIRIMKELKIGLSEAATLPQAFFSKIYRSYIRVINSVDREFRESDMRKLRLMNISI